DINGRSIEQHIQRTIFEALPSPLADAVYELWRPVLETGEEVRDYEIKGKTSEAPGVLCDWLLNLTPLRSNDGVIIGGIGVVVEITERKRLEAAQHESERQAIIERKRFQDFAETSAEFFWEFDQDMRFTYVKSQTYINDEQLIGRSPRDIYAPTPEAYQLNEAIWEEHLRAIQERRPFRAHEFEVMGSDGKQEIASVSGNPMFDDQGNYIGYRGTANTVTSKYREAALTAAKDAAEAANASKGEFLSNMSHEIRTPMNAILGLSHLLDRTGLTAEQADLVGKISLSGKALLGILNDILDFSKIDAGKLDIEGTDFLLSDVTSTLASIMSVAVGSKPVETVIGIAPGVPKLLHGAPTRLQQILVNLVGNAIKFTESGEVVAYVEMTEQSSDKVVLRFTVRDTGIGVSEYEQARLFQPFVQADMTTTRRYGGTGLGLAICKRLVELMGGTIGMTSYLGKGSEFYFLLPFQLGQPAESELESDSEPVLANLDVLVVDDNASARMFISAAAESIGMNTDTVDSGEHALDRLHEKVEAGDAYDLLLIDWQMPGMNGLETSRKIREDAILAGTRPPIVILVTAYTREEVLQAPDSRFVDGMLVKPVTSSALLNIVAEIQTARHGGPGAILAEIRRGNRCVARRLEGLRILVVEDNSINQDVARLILEDEGAFVELAEDGTDAVARLLDKDAASFDLVLMDVQMPVMDGFTATALIRENARMKSLPIIALTAGVRIDDQERCLGCGMNGFISKPFDVTKLVHTILRHVGRGDDIRTGSSAFALLNGKVAAAMASCRIDIPGLDLHQALMRVGGKEDLLRSMLKRLTIDFEAVGERLRADLKGGLTDQAARLAHTLRGSAGNLAATELAGMATRIEAAIRAGEPEVAISPMVNELETIFAAFGAAVSAMADIDEIRVAGVLDLAKLKALTAMLERGDLNALTDYRDLRPVIIGHLSAEQRLTLDRAIEELDLDVAVRILKPLSLGAA
ncbi:MAG: response regulator, partial [Rhodospirillaceae bacterium]